MDNISEGPPLLDINRKPVPILEGRQHLRERTPIELGSGGKTAVEFTPGNPIKIRLGRGDDAQDLEIVDRAELNKQLRAKGLAEAPKNIDLALVDWADLVGDKVHGAVPLPEEKVVLIGRAHNSNTFEHGGKISANHLLVLRKRDSRGRTMITIDDLGSSNGTSVIRYAPKT